MKKIVFFIFLILIAFILLLIIAESYRNEPFYIVRNLALAEKISLKHKETNFKLDYFGILPVARVEIENKGIVPYQDNKVYLMQAKVEAFDFISGIIKINGLFSSYIDIEHLYPLKFTQKIKVMDKPEDIKEVFYDQKNNEMELRGIKRQVLANTMDPLSAVFYIQNQQFELAKVFDLNINTNQKNYRFLAKIIERKEYVIANKKIAIWIMEAKVTRRQNDTRHGSSIKLWLLDNPSKTPILIRTMTNIGYVTARLIELN